MLVKDRSTFQSMFSLDVYRMPKEYGPTSPADATIREGTDDNNPVVLQGDTVHEFRALLWSLYSLCVLEYYKLDKPKG